MSSVAKPPVANLSVPDDLPIAEHVASIGEALRTRQVVIVAGETGSGKTTQLPKICAGVLGLGKTIGITQPRRLAARGVASRLAAETGLASDSGVALRMRFEDQGRRDAPFRVMTDGVLLNEVVNDRHLRSYQAVILDEAHERSLNIDFLLGCLKKTLALRPEFRLIVTSATINTDLLARFFDDAPVVEVSGRGFPISYQYLPPASGDSLPASIWNALQHVNANNSKEGGDTLVFLPGEREIHETRDYLSRRFQRLAAGKRSEVLAIYGRLGDKEQRKIFSPGKNRRVVLATNIAETSLTVPRIRTVIDSGLVRISRYATRARVQRLETEFVSQASAKQRAGRCGRLGPGICVRLYDEQTLLAQPAFSDPEIVRTHLSSVVLRLLASKLGKIDSFPWIDPPDPGQINDAYQLLRELNALDRSRQITKTGRDMARLPLDPRLARVVIEGYRRGIGSLTCRVVAGLSISDVRIVPDDARSAAKRVHKAYEVAGSDVATQLRIYDAWQQMRGERGRRAQTEWYSEQFLSPRRLFDWQELENDIKRVARGLKLKEGRAPRKPESVVTQVLLSGFCMQVGRLDESKTYAGPRGGRFVPHPSSAAASQPPPWVMATSYLRTRETYGLGLVGIKPGWLKSVASHLVRRSLTEIRWDSERELVVADVSHALYDLLIAVDKAEPVEARSEPLIREVFIRHALVAGDVKRALPFAEHNQQALVELTQLEGRLRRALRPTDAQLIEFYDARLPAQINSLSQLLDWWSRASDSEQSALRFSVGDWVSAEAVSEALSNLQMPEQVSLDGNVFPVRYQFSPGDLADGAAIEVPAILAEQLPLQIRDNAIPGLLKDRVLGFLRALPKSDRRKLQPLAQRADTLCDELRITNRSGTLADRLGVVLAEQFGITVERAWATYEEPPHLLLKVNAIAGSQDTLAGGQETAAPTLTLPPASFPISDPLEVDGNHVPRWRALQPAAEAGVKENYFSSAFRAQQSQRESIWHLAGLKVRPALQRAAKSIRARPTIVLGFARFSWADGLAEDLWRAIIRRELPPEVVDCVASDEGFLRVVGKVRGELVERIEHELPALEELARQLIELSRQCDDLEDRYAAPVADVRGQLEWLISDGFLTSHGIARLADIQRYLRAIIYRLGKLPQVTARDEVAMAEIVRLEKRWSAQPRAVQDANPNIAWQLQELRVSLFAESIGAKGKVSPARIQRAIDAAASRQD